MDDINRYVGELSESVWAQMLGLELVPESAGSPICEGGSVEGRVRISGEWEGTLVLQCSTTLARRAAQRMFGRDSAAERLQDVEDAIGELTNIIGGNVKALVSSDGCTLSMPLVRPAQDLRVDISGSRLLTRQVFSSEGQPVVVTLLETERR